MLEVRLSRSPIPLPNRRFLMYGVGIGENKLKRGAVIGKRIGVLGEWEFADIRRRKAEERVGGQVGWLASLYTNLYTTITKKNWTKCQ